mmetsp:Transcript_4762/g.12255  ORF Transcript_4762/g.12255 Transcript_4762/m.12255 type:complete len:258 (-) Transcript_4762:875-1648(-)
MTSACVAGGTCKGSPIIAPTAESTWGMLGATGGPHSDGGVIEAIWCMVALWVVGALPVCAAALEAPSPRAGAAAGRSELGSIASAARRSAGMAARPAADIGGATAAPAVPAAASAGSRAPGAGPSAAAAPPGPPRPCCFLRFRDEFFDVGPLRAMVDFSRDSSKASLGTAHEGSEGEPCRRSASVPRWPSSRAMASAVCPRCATMLRSVLACTRAVTTASAAGAWLQRAHRWSAVQPSLFCLCTSAPLLMSSRASWG